ncbi:MAG: hypothetical protein QG658_639 [Patescibacteria group bacterium]|nr:hypothetical protein [Patescibacteria group bacterium]
MNKKKMIAAAIASLGIASVVGVGTVAAQEANSTSLADRIATEFNLNKKDVQKVIDEDRDARHEEMQKKVEERLQEAVDAGKLTVEQKDKIIAKMEEVHEKREAQREEMQNMTRDERRAAMQAQREELQQWAKDNNIPTDYMMFGGRGHGPGPGGMRGNGPAMEAPDAN